MITLYDYQQKGVNDLINALKDCKNRGVNKFVLLEMPTGGGKTVVFSSIAQKANLKGSNVLILTDREELLKGSGSTLTEFNLNVEYIKAGRVFAPETRKGGVFVAMAQTLKKRINKRRWHPFFERLDLIIIDEAHKQEFNKFFESEIFEGKTVIAVTATPYRSGKMRQLGEDYQTIIHTATVPELIEKGTLVPEMYFGYDNLAPDMAGVKKNSLTGDFSETDMFKKYDSPVVYSGALEAWKEHSFNEITLVFCSNIIHCVRTCKQFNDAGIKAKFLVSNMSKPKKPSTEEPFCASDELPAEWVKYYEKLAYYNEYTKYYKLYSGERSEVLNSWRSGEYFVLINAGILTTGFDFKPIQSLIILRATVSVTLWLQILGRGSRASKETLKTHFKVFDFGGNARRLGGYRLRRKWSLWHEQKSGGGNPPIKKCGENLDKDKNGRVGCGSFIFASAKICEYCGFIYPEKKESKKIELSLMAESSGGLVKIKPIKDMDYSELVEFAKKQKYKRFWVYMQLWNRGGEAELKKFAKFMNYHAGWITIVKSTIQKRAGRKS